MFELHPRLAADTIPVGDLPLCRVLLMNDMHYPWLILVPRKDKVREIFELNGRDQQQLNKESVWLARCLNQGFQADKINIAALGNMVPQLHIHHIARYQNDAAWPAPVWGKHPASPYDADTLAMMMARLRDCLAGAEKMGMVWSDDAATEAEPVAE